MSKIYKALILVICLIAISFVVVGKETTINGKQAMREINKEQVAIDKYFKDSNFANKDKEVKWQEYYNIKKELFNLSPTKDTIRIICKTLKAVAIAQTLNREDILAWQYNNIGKEIINVYIITPPEHRVELYDLMVYGLKCMEIANQVDLKLPKDKKVTIKRNLEFLKTATYGIKLEGETNGK